MQFMNREAFLNREVLVTGGLGFIGSTLAHRLMDLGARVTLVDSLIPEYGGNLFNIAGIEDRVKVNIADIRDEHSMRYLIQGKDYLFNLAGQTSHLDSMKNPHIDLDINCRAQLAILEACRIYNPRIRVVFASTRQIYGKPDYFPVDEKHPLRPVDVNGINKMAGEFYHQLYSEVHDIWTCCLRLTNTVGPRMRIKDDRQTFLGLWIRRLLEDRTIEVWGGTQLRDFTFVDDAVDAFLLAATNENTNGQVLNVGGNSVISLQDLAELLVQVNGQGQYNLCAYPSDRKRIDIGDYYADFSKAKSMLGWQPAISLADSLDRTIRFYRQHLHKYL